MVPDSVRATFFVFSCISGTLEIFCVVSLGWWWRRSFTKDAFVADSDNLGRWTWACQTWIVKTVQTMHVMHAPVPAAAEIAAIQTVHPAAAAGGLAQVRKKHAQSKGPSWYAFGKPACTCFNCRCRPRRHFEQCEEHQNIVFLQAKWERTTRL